MKKISIEIKIKPDDWDSDDINFIVDGKRAGSGYKGKDDGKIHIVSCPACGKENYAIMVAKGACAWCGLDASEL